LTEQNRGRRRPTQPKASNLSHVMAWHEWEDAISPHGAYMAAAQPISSPPFSSL
jgi:hypothetical protein